MITLGMVVPCYNEEETLQECESKLWAKIVSLIDDNQISNNSFILFVDDGSRDNTWRIIRVLNSNNSHIYGLKLSKNEGHQTAIMAGMMFAKKMADVVITIDADLQQDINAIPLFIQKYMEGNDIVYGVRTSRETDTAFKRITALGYYHLMKILGCDIRKNSADYRLLSKRALDALEQYEERDLFIRGIIPTLGFSSAEVKFDVVPRKYGRSKYTCKKMINLALDGVTSFSMQPIRLITKLGVLTILICLFMVIKVIIDYYMGNTVSGWSSLMVGLFFLGGVQLLSIGVVGEYVGRTYMETKKRPRYFIDQVLCLDMKGSDND